jgi:hypothetical protein
VVGAAEATLKGSCEVHTDRPAIERCASCGRRVCLACAVPFRERVLCTTCARRALGDPDPPEPKPIPRRIPIPTLVAFALGLAATAVPWDRFGPRTSMFSAWRWSPDPWSFVACVSLAFAVTVSMVGRLLPTPLVARAGAFFGVAAAASAGWMLVASPEYVRHTPAPYIALAGALAGALIAWLPLRRRRRLG